MPIAVEGRTIRDVSVISTGDTVDGRFEITGQTLADVLSVMSGKPDGTKVLADHDAEVEDIIGRLVNPRLSDDGASLRADLEVFDAAEAGNIILESAAKMPSEFGLSINAHSVTVEKGVLRVHAMKSVDLTGHPAANRSGLLSVDNPARPNGSTTTPTTPDMTPEEIKTIVAECMAPLSEKMAALEAKLAEAPAAPVPPTEEEEKAVEAAKMSAIADAVTAKLRASLGLGEGVKLSIAAVSEPAKGKQEETPGVKFSALVAELVKSGKSRTDAIRLAATQNHDIYRAALAAPGGLRL